MIELGPGAGLLRMLGGFFWLVVLGAFVAAFLIPKTRKSKTIVVAVVAVLFAAFPGRWFWEMQSEANVKKARLAKAEAMFQERCKTAGEFIYRTVEDVEGVLLMKLRLEAASHGDQFKMDDPYGSDSWGDDYIKSFFLEPILLANQYQPPEILDRVRRDDRGYRYVDAIDPQDGKRYRYTGRIDQPWLRDKHYGEWVRQFVLDKVPATDPAPRYGVTYDDISTLDDREYWIAGSSLRIVDLETNEVIAERIGYMMDRGQGALSTGGSQTAWLRAARHACPDFRPSNARDPASSYQAGQTRKFVTKVLQPTQPTEGK